MLNRTKSQRMVELSLSIKCSNADKANVTIDSSASVLELKGKISEILSVPASQQRLIYKGRVLKDESTLEDYQVCDGHTVHMVKSASAPGSAPSSGGGGASSSSSAPTPFSAPPPPHPGSNLSGTNNPMANPFALMQGMQVRGGPGTPDVNQMHNTLMNNPEMMQQIMNSPMMDNLMNNPDMMRNMMTNNPQMQAMLDANPQMRHVLNDPQVHTFSSHCCIILYSLI